MAAADGIVVESFFHSQRGNYVVVKHGDTIRLPIRILETPWLRPVIELKKDNPRLRRSTGGQRRSFTL